MSHFELMVPTSRHNPFASWWTLLVMKLIDSIIPNYHWNITIISISFITKMYGINKNDNQNLASRDLISSIYTYSSSPPLIPRSNSFLQILRAKSFCFYKNILVFLQNTKHSNMNKQTFTPWNFKLFCRIYQSYEEFTWILLRMKLEIS